MISDHLWFVKNDLNVEGEDQSAMLIIEDGETKVFVVAEVEDPRIECALKIWVSIPASFMIHLSHRANEVGVTGLWGWMYERNNRSGLDESPTDGRSF